MMGERLGGELAAQCQTAAAILTHKSNEPIALNGHNTHRGIEKKRLFAFRCEIEIYIFETTLSLAERSVQFPANRLPPHHNPLSFG